MVGSDAFFRALVESAVSPYIVIDASLTLLYASESIAELLGWEPQDWVGRSIIDLLAPESLEIAAAGIDDLFATTNDPTWVGGPVRLFVRCADGSMKALDIEASSPERTGIDGIVVHLHRAGGSQAMSDAIDAILEGENPKLALTRLASLIEHDITDATAVLASEWDGVGFGQVAGAMGPLHLPAPRTADRDAIYAALRSSADVVDLFDSLDPLTRADGLAAGMQSCWLAPVRVAPDEPTTAALLVWHILPGPPGALYRADVDRAVRLAQLALRWEGQQRMLAWDATHDRLTGLTNRSEFQNRLDRHHGTGRAVLYCDLDDFKPVNDRFGHRAGDEVLATVAGRLRETVGAHLAGAPRRRRVRRAHRGPLGPRGGGHRRQPHPGRDPTGHRGPRPARHHRLQHRRGHRPLGSRQRRRAARRSRPGAARGQGPGEEPGARGVPGGDDLRLGPRSVRLRPGASTAAARRPSARAGAATRRAAGRRWRP